MAAPDVLKGRRILAVDDEPDVLDVIREELSLCLVTTAQDFDTAEALIASEKFDLAILDIMGVNGFLLLDHCTRHKIPAAMLTAHAISTDNINKAVRLGAVSFLPKEELARLPELVAEILECVAEGKGHWETLFQRLGPYFKERLGLEWEEMEKPRYPPYSY